MVEENCPIPEMSVQEWTKVPLLSGTTGFPLLFGTYRVPPELLRGGFRYLTVGLETSGSAELTGVTVYFTPAPTLSDLRAYRGPFRSNDDLLNRAWYAGAYTVQMDTTDPLQGKAWPPAPLNWLNNGVTGSGTTILVDGAKRDRWADLKI